MLHFEVAELIPQQPPFVFIDALVDVDEKSARTNFTINNNCLLLENEQLSTSGILENIAQTAAAKIGYENKIHCEAVRIGVIGSVKDLSVKRFPKIGETLSTSINEILTFQDMKVVEAKVCAIDEEIASCQLSVAVI